MDRHNARGRMDAPPVRESLDVTVGLRSEKTGLPFPLPSCHPAEQVGEKQFFPFRLNSYFRVVQCLCFSFG